LRAVRISGSKREKAEGSSCGGSGREGERERREEKGSGGKGYDNTGLRLKEQYKDSGRKEE
jgi:hypothetical protein